jgi:hypothetical protein
MAAEDFVSVTFIKAYDYAHTFKCAVGLSAETKRRKVRRWLFLLLYNTFLDSRKGEKREPFFRPVNSDDGLLLDFPELGPIAETSGISARRKNLVLNFIERLDPLDQAILKLTAQYWSPSAKKTVMHDDVRKAICRELGLTENSLRVRRIRAIERLETFILQTEKQTNNP